jgi:hypothetical protein
MRSKRTPVLLPEMMLRAAGEVPPMTTLALLALTPTPLRSGAVPAASVPIRLPCMTVPGAAALTPPASLPEMRLPAPGSVPPTTLPTEVEAVPLIISMPHPSPPPASKKTFVPVTSVPM